MSLENLVKDIYNTVANGIGKFNDKNVNDLNKSITHSVHKQLLTKNRIPRNTLRMSNIGKPECQLWHELNGSPQEELEPHVRIKFLFGDIIEALLLFLVKESGYKVTHEQSKVQVDGIVGHIDCKIEGVTVDVKSASTHAFKKFANGTVAEDDPFGYIAQLSGYAHADNKTEAGFLAMDKQMGKIAYLNVDEIDMIDVPKRIKHLKGVVKSNTPPQRCFTAEPDGKSGNMKLGRNCSYCNFKDTCWSDANNGDGLRLFLYSTGPRWLPPVEREPDVFEVTN